MRSTGSGSMITPVENGSTCSGWTCNRAANAALAWRARTRPSSPVPALALPVLISRARMPAPAARRSRQTCTGAAQKRFCVNTPPTLVPSSSRKTVRSLRPCLRTPASATPMRTPATGNSLAGSGAERWTGMENLGQGMWPSGAGTRRACAQVSAPWQCLYFLPLPQGQGSLRPTRGTSPPRATAAAPAAAATPPPRLPGCTCASPVSVGEV